MAAQNLPFVIFQVKGGLYAVGSENVREIVMLPKVSEVPDQAPEVRGVINLRGKVMPLIDLRVKLGMASATVELEALLQLLYDREQDHRNWLTELEACVRTGRPFQLARDPHACKFGLWYDHYQTDNSLLKMALKNMVEPHRVIHATADLVLQMAAQGDQAGALARLAERREQELAELVKLFRDAREALTDHQRELAVVLSRGERRFAISIDAVEAVERIPEESIEPMSAALTLGKETNQWRVGKRVKTNQTILLPDESFLFASETIKMNALRPT